MIYLKLSDGRDLLILEPGNLERLQQGKIATTSDGRIALAYTPDMPWLSEQITAAAKAGTLDQNLLAGLLTQGLQREPVVERSYHPNHTIIRDGQVIREDA